MHETSNTPYKFSTDYRQLYGLICNGKIAVGFVDYVMSEKRVCRDVCQIRRLKPYDISISVRGVFYGTVGPFQKNEGKEYELFESSCRSLNLEWVTENQKQDLLHFYWTSAEAAQLVGKQAVLTADFLVPREKSQMPKFILSGKQGFIS